MPSPADLLGRARARLSPIGHIATWEPSPADRAAARARRPLDRLYLRRAGDLPAHERLGRSVAEVAPPPRPDAPRVLVVSLRAWPDHNAIQMVLGLALRLRGAEVALLTCGGGQPKCEVGWGRRAWPRPCDRCAWYTDRLQDAAGLRAYRLRDHLPWGGRPGDAPAAPSHADPAFDARKATEVSVAWSLRTSSPLETPLGPAVADDYGVAAEGVRAAAEAIFADFRPDVVFGFNGVMASDRVIRELARERGLLTPTYEAGPRAGSFVWGQDGPAAKLDVTGLWERHRDVPLTAEQDAALDALLHAREAGSNPQERFFEATEDDPRVLRARLGLPERAPVTALFTNVSWDSAALGADVAWPSMLDFIEDAVRRAGARPDRHLVLRIHPAEVRFASREQVVDVLRARMGELPGNVRVIGPGQALSSYALLDMADRALVYTTTVGMEASVRGVPVAVAGDVHYRGKGFTRDLERRDELDDVLDAPAAPLEPAKVELARRFVYTFFFRSLVPFPPVEPTPTGGVARLPADADALRPGRDPYLDFLCERILDGGDFHLPEELAQGGSVEPAPEHPAPIASESARRV